METMIPTIRSMTPKTNGEAMIHVVGSCAIKIESQACFETDNREDELVQPLDLGS